MPDIKPEEQKHPDYLANIDEWHKFRSTFEGGKSCVDEYLVKFSVRETEPDFTDRKTITHCPAHAKGAVYEVRNAILQRMVDIQRSNGPTSYMAAIANQNSGVDLNGNTMNSFIGRIVLPEMLALSKVGVYVDRQPVDGNASLRDIKVTGNRPYIYIFKAEDIFSWALDSNNQFTALFLREHLHLIDPITGLTNEIVEQYRHLILESDGVLVLQYDSEGQQISSPIKLNLPQIPFVLFELNQSLLEDIADFQISLLNLGSSDIAYLLKSNYPFYTEQYDAASELPNIRQAAGSKVETADGVTNLPGTAADANKASRNEALVGSGQGRRYPKGVERPNFINPSPEPVKVSMEKQDKLQKEIRVLIDLALTNIQPGRASAESKEHDEHGLEAGLSYIGIELEYGERQIAELWAMYESDRSETLITYPTSYSLRTDADRRIEAKELKELQSSVPSEIFQRKIAKQIASVSLGHKIKLDELRKIEAQIDSAKVIETDPEILIKDHEAGFISTEAASRARLYPDGEVEAAKKDHAERAARIAEAQSKVSTAARGVPDNDDDPAASKDNDGPQPATTGN